MDFITGFAALGSGYSSNDGITGAIIFLIVLFVLVVVVLCTAPSIIMSWQLYKKAGRPGWAALVPFYDTYVFGEISKRPMWVIWTTIASYAVGCVLFPPAFLVFMGFWIYLFVGFVRQYRANAGIWVCYFLLPIVGMFLVKNHVEYIGGTNNQGGQANGMSHAPIPNVETTPATSIQPMSSPTSIQPMRSSDTSSHHGGTSAKVGAHVAANAVLKQTVSSNQHRVGGNHTVAVANNKESSNKAGLIIVGSVIGSLVFVGVIIALAIFLVVKTWPTETTNTTKPVTTQTTTKDKTEMSSACLAQTDYEEMPGYSKDLEYNDLYRWSDYFFFSKESLNYSYPTSASESAQKIASFYNAKSGKDFTIEISGTTYKDTSSSTKSLISQRTEKVKAELTKSGVSANRITILPPHEYTTNQPAGYSLIDDVTVTVNPGCDTKTD